MLSRKYAELLDEYKSLRRYFGLTALVPFTDVWMYKPVQVTLESNPVKNRQTCCGRSSMLVAGRVIWWRIFHGFKLNHKSGYGVGTSCSSVELESERFVRTVKEIQGE